MHWLTMVTLFVVLTLVGVEFSVSAFFHPAARRLEPEPQKRLLSRLAVVLGRVMPIWYPAATLLLVCETYLRWHTPARSTLLVGTAIWAVTSVASILYLVPLNNRVAQGAPDWKQAHGTWDQRHRIRIAALAVAAILLAYAVTS